MSGSGTGTPAVAVSSSLTVASWTGAPFVLERLTQPEIEPVTLAEMRTHLRAFNTTAEDDMINGLIVAAREWVEDYTGRALVDQKWRITVNNTGGPIGGPPYTNVEGYSSVGWQWWQRRGEILLRKSPILAITSFVTADSAGVETAVDPAVYGLCEPDSKWPRIVGLSGGTWATGLKIEFRAGFADRLGSPVQGAEVVPYRFLQAIKLHVEANYDRDEKTMQMLLDVAERLIRPERSELQMA